jgi:hypothetical protein
MILQHIKVDAGLYVEIALLRNMTNIKIKKKKLKNVNVLKVLPFGIVISP